MGLGFFASLKIKLIKSCDPSDKIYLYMAMTMTAVRMTARTTRIAIRKLRFMFRVERAPTNSMSQCS